MENYYLLPSLANAYYVPHFLYSNYITITPMLPEQEQVLLELEMILATAKQINGNLEKSINLLEEPFVGKADYQRVLRDNTQSLQQILTLLEEKV